MSDQEPYSSETAESPAEKAFRLFLIGPSGAGKSAVAESLSQETGIALVDTDKDIEETTGLSIEEIFAKFGEPHFRSLESACIDRLSEDSRPAIVATGGGLPIQPGMFDRLDRMGICVYLKASTQRMWRRLQLDEGGLDRRPLLRTGGFEGFESLVTPRLPIYSRAPIVLDTERLTTSRVCHLLAEVVSLEGSFKA